MILKYIIFKSATFPHFSSVWFQAPSYEIYHLCPRLLLSTGTNGLESQLCIFCNTLYTSKKLILSPVMKRKSKKIISCLKQ